MKTRAEERGKGTAIVTSEIGNESEYGSGECKSEKASEQQEAMSKEREHWRKREGEPESESRKERKQEGEVKENGYFILFCNLQNDPERRERYEDDIIAWIWRTYLDDEPEQNQEPILRLPMTKVCHLKSADSALHLSFF